MDKQQKHNLMKYIMTDADQKVANLAGHLISSPSKDKEAILAEMNFNRALSELCQIARS